MDLKDKVLQLEENSTSQKLEFSNKKSELETLVISQ